MNYLIMHHGFKSKYYDPMGIKKDDLEFIQVDHVAQFCNYLP